MLSNGNLRNGVATHFLAALVALCFATTSWAERFALVIGNESYPPMVGELQNPIKDAKFVGRALEDAGFDVKTLFDADHFTLLAAVEAHARRLSVAGDDAVGFLYYAGHGAARPDTRENVIIPIDVVSPNASDFWVRALPLERIQTELSALAPDAAHIVVFDACRNELRIGARGRRNFLPVGHWPNMLIAFSTGENDVAVDGDPEAIAGPYAQALVQEIRKARTIRAPILFANVKTTFRDRFKEMQSPYYVDKLAREVRFDGALRRRQLAQGDLRCDEEFSADLWELVERSNSPGMATAFVRHCRGTAGAERAEAWLQTNAPDVVANLPVEWPDENATISTELFDLIEKLESNNTEERRAARASLTGGGLDAVLAILSVRQQDPDELSYRFQLGAVVAFTEMLRSDKALRSELSKNFSQDDIEWIVGLSAHPDRTMRIYASEFLYDLGDPRVINPAIDNFPNSSANGKYNLALVLKGAAPFMPRPDGAVVAERLIRLKSPETPKTNALIDDAISLLPR